MELNSTNPTLDPTKAKLRRRRDLFHVKQSFRFFSLLLLQSNSLLPPFNNGFGTPFIWPTRLQVFKKVENSSNGNPRWLPFFLHKLQRVIRRAFAFCSWCAVQKEKKEKAREIWEICQKRRSRAIQFCTAFHSSKTNPKDKAPHNFSMHLYGALGFVRRRRRSLDSRKVFPAKNVWSTTCSPWRLVDFRPRRKKFLFKAASNWTKKCKKYRKRSHLW